MLRPDTLRELRALVALLFLAAGSVATAATAQSGCLSCHDGIEPFSRGGMDIAIKALSKTFDTSGCTVCHGGDPNANTVDKAHAGSSAALLEIGGATEFYPDPGSMWIAEKTCGLCHSGYNQRLKKSLMATETGKLQGNFWAWGLTEERVDTMGNYDIQDSDGMVPQVGTDAYKNYMDKMINQFPDHFPRELHQVRDVDVDTIPDHPNQAGITYSRQQCQRCHVGVTGSQRRGDFRGTGCSACHVPYSLDGFYEGNDPILKEYIVNPEFRRTKVD